MRNMFFYSFLAKRDAPHSQLVSLTLVMRGISTHRLDSHHAYSMHRHRERAGGRGLHFGGCTEGRGGAGAAPRSAGRRAARLCLPLSHHPRSHTREIIGVSLG